MQKKKKKKLKKRKKKEIQFSAKGGYTTQMNLYKHGIALFLRNCIISTWDNTSWVIFIPTLKTLNKWDHNSSDEVYDL